MEQIYNNMVGISVRFDTAATTHYTYCVPSSTDIFVGDSVVVMTSRGSLKVVEVMAVDVPLDVTGRWETIVSVIDTTEYEEWTQNRNDIEILNESINERIDILHRTPPIRIPPMIDPILEEMSFTLRNYLRLNEPEDTTSIPLPRFADEEIVSEEDPTIEETLHMHQTLRRQSSRVIGWNSFREGGGEQLIIWDDLLVPHVGSDSLSF